MTDTDLFVAFQEALANAYQRLDFPEEALFHLDDLDQVITQFVADAAQGTLFNPLWFAQLAYPLIPKIRC